MAPIPKYLLPPPEPGLGFDPISIITTAGTVSNIASRLLGSSKGAKRKRDAEDLLTRAAGGDVVAEAQLRLLSGAGTVQDIATMRAAGLDPGCTDPSQCGWATTEARTYGKGLLLELQARRVAGVVGVELIGRSTIPSVIGATIGSVATNPFVWLAVGAGILLLLRRRR